MHSLAAVLKFWRAVGLVLRGWWTIRFTFPKLSPDERALRVQQWAQQMLAAMGVQLVVQGTPPAVGPVLVISNHLSWLDILAIHGARHMRFVSKSGVKAWPVIGALSTGAGSLYIERERRRDALRVVHHMTEALRSGDLVAIFPEGTTSDGRGLLPFHANLLQAAISSGAPVQPAALRFAEAATGETSQAPRYIDDDNLLTSVWNTLKAPPLLAIVRFGEPQSSYARERRSWAQSLHQDVQQLRRDTF
ncbi:lysophospholipid acyltransferase family protein [Variovorax sp. PAMC 28711]|uniref:lysophospholipid acyltransferase family protein n=1 Tax=Variovorax sp. PAMC 28711 TaxID=1795631 RepID=UPI00078CB4B3|nr:lysophospholipid acyltransferase family protein [Variovorax sp. PAMC 28711]AMM25305.1 glycerol acyltransferase [Variovorax sp. PAMC 28711]